MFLKIRPAEKRSKSHEFILEQNQVFTVCLPVKTGQSNSRLLKLFFESLPHHKGFSKGSTTNIGEILPKQDLKDKSLENKCKRLTQC